jgi:hypothetical protein
VGHYGYSAEAARRNLIVVETEKLREMLGIISSFVLLQSAEMTIGELPLHAFYDRFKLSTTLILTTTEEVISFSLREPLTSLETLYGVTGSSAELSVDADTQRGYMEISMIVFKSSVYGVEEYNSNPISLIFNKDPCARSGVCNITLDVAHIDQTEVYRPRPPILGELFNTYCNETNDNTTHSYTCENGQEISYTCTGKPETVTSRCPIAFHESNCRRISSNVFSDEVGDDSACEMVKTITGRTTCSCPLPSSNSSSRRLAIDTGINAASVISTVVATSTQGYHTFSDDSFAQPTKFPTSQPTSTYAPIPPPKETVIFTPTVVAFMIGVPFFIILAFNINRNGFANNCI